jgi:hypothetical protein
MTSLAQSDPDSWIISLFISVRSSLNELTSAVFRHCQFSNSLKFAPGFDVQGGMLCAPLLFFGWLLAINFWPHSFNSNLILN